MTNAISPITAVSLCIAITAFYVGGLYAADAPTLFRTYHAYRRRRRRQDTPVNRTDATPDVDPPPPVYSRNEDRVIKRRFCAVALICGAVPVVVADTLELGFFDFLKIAGIRFDNLLGTAILPFVLTCLLFAGPLALLAADGDLLGQQGFAGLQSDLKYALGDLRGIRNFVVGPLSEEWIFRGCTTLLLLAGGLSDGTVIFCAPLLFGIAHVHHAWEFYHSNSDRKTGIDYQRLKLTLLRSTFQFTYTTIFGWYAMFLLLRTGSILAPILSHIFCNIIGFPDFAGIRRHPEKQIYLAGIFIVGLLSFGFCLFPFTDLNAFHGAP